jgi:phage terminase large subunit GpA-like protein
MTSAPATTLDPRQHPRAQTAARFRVALDLVAWTETYRQLSARTTAPGLSGPWRWDLVPFLVEPYLAWSDYRVRQVDVSGCTQFGKSELAHNILAYTIDQDPAPVLLVMPTEDEVKNRVNTRIRELVRANPRLLEYLGGDDRKITIDRATDFQSCLLYIGWPNSPVTLGDKAIGRIILDELKDFPGVITDRGDVISLARDRLRTYGSFGKMLCASSPTVPGSLIEREIERGDQRTAVAPCPHCCRYQQLLWENVSLDQDADDRYLPPEAYAHGGHARYVCPYCRAPWTEADRAAANARTVWLPKGAAVTALPGAAFADLPLARAVAWWTHRFAPAELPQQFPAIAFAWGDPGAAAGAPPPQPWLPPAAHVSFQEISGLMLHHQFETVDRMAAQWAEAEADRVGGDSGPMQTFVNNQLGQTWNAAAAAFTEDALDSHCDAYPVATVPAPVPGTIGPELITVGLDVQAAEVYATLWAWGYAFEAWLLDFTRIHVSDSRNVENWAAVTTWLHGMSAMLAAAPGPTGPAGIATTLRVNFGLCDHQYQPQAVEAWCARVAGLWTIEPCQGEDRQAVLIRPSILGAKRTAQRHRQRRHDPGLPLEHLDVNAFKDRLAAMMENKRPGPGRIHFPAGLTPQFKAQFCSEVRVAVTKGRRTTYVWVPRKKNLPNHWWDCSVYALAAAELAGVRNLIAPDQRVSRPRVRLSDLRPRDQA